MRKVAFGITVAMLMSVSVAAMAAGPITRDGANFNGSIPKDCPVFEVVGDSLHVRCTSSNERSDHTRVRYRFLNDVGGRRGPATVSAEVAVLSGPENCYGVRWMENPRTLRITIRNTHPMCEVMIESVTWSQP